MTTYAVRRAEPSSTGPHPCIVMLLDNHYGPDPRVALETQLLSEAGLAARVIAWDRRTKGLPNDSSAAHAEVVRVPVPAPSGGGWRTFVALGRLSARVWRGRNRLFEGASVLIVHDVYLLPLGWALARRLRLPFAYDAHEEFALMEARRYPQWLLRCITAVESSLARKAVAVIVPGVSRAPRWRGVLRRAPIVLPNLVQHSFARPHLKPIEWDLLYAGTIADVRRPDLLIDLARRHPDLRIAIAGRGRSERQVERAAEELPNLTYLGWQPETGRLFARSAVIYYGLDPAHPYSEVACPNTLYEALRHRKPLIFFCGGEVAQLASEFKIGIRCEPSVDALSAALNEVAATSRWEFEPAWREVWERADTQRFVDVIEAAARSAQ
jgi:glycosyltransferase involved in cell wall biosynthesis